MSDNPNGAFVPLSQGAFFMDCYCGFGITGIAFRPLWPRIRSPEMLRSGPPSPWRSTARSRLFRRCTVPRWPSAIAFRSSTHLAFSISFANSVPSFGRPEIGRTTTVPKEHALSSTPFFLHIQVNCVYKHKNLGHRVRPLASCMRVTWDAAEKVASRPCESL